MFLNDTPFFKDTRVWRNNFMDILTKRTTEYWNSYEFNIDEYIDKVYVLHLPHRVDKVKHIKSRLQTIKTKQSTLLDSVTMWPGYFGKTEWDSNLHNPNYSFQYCWSLDPTPKLYDILGRIPSANELENINIVSSLAESNIALGHLSILQDIVDNSIEHAFILEDDIDFTMGFSWLMEKTFKQLPDDWDMFYVSYQPCMYGFKSKPFSEDLVKIESGIWWLSGVFISQRAAKYLLSNLPVIGPIDVWINHHLQGLNVYGTKYNAIGQIKYLESDNTHSFRDAFKKIELKKDI